MPKIPALNSKIYLSSIPNCAIEIIREMDVRRFVIEWRIKDFFSRYGKSVGCMLPQSFRILSTVHPSGQEK